MFGKVKHRILDIIMNKFSEKTFSACIMSNITDFVHKDLKTGVSFHYLTPDNLCRKYSGLRNTKPQFSAGAIMAVFDEISTYSTVMRDKTHRPGLSVHLSTEILKPVYTGEKVTVLTKADKLGKTIGFCSMELLNQQGELVARGKHIRYLQMGMPFDLIAHPVAMPWTVKIYEMFYARKGAPSFSANGKEIFPVPANFPSIDGVGRVFDVLGLQRTPNIAHNEPDSEETDIASSAAGPLSPLYCSDNGRVDPSTVHSFSMTVRPVTSNVLGAMHGGAVACAVEHACLLSRAGNAAPDGSLRGAQGAYDLDCYVQSVEVRYIAAMKGDLVITVVEDVHAPQLPDVSGAVGGAGEGRRWPSKSFGRVLSKDDGTLCAEYVCSWTR
jgi:acyl-coenzyme A thioesterase PaaI-like protein